jgi:hypothetical protein
LNDSRYRFYMMCSRRDYADSLYIFVLEHLSQIGVPSTIHLVGDLPCQFFLLVTHRNQLGLGHFLDIVSVGVSETPQADNANSQIVHT